MENTISVGAWARRYLWIDAKILFVKHLKISKKKKQATQTIPFLRHAASNFGNFLNSRYLYEHWRIATTPHMKLLNIGLHFWTAFGLVIFPRGFFGL